jgi:ribosomal-protein-alanine N-acetyltransferase
VPLPPFLVEPAGPDDLDALTHLERRCYTHPWTARGFREALRHPEQGSVIVARSASLGDGARGILGYCVTETVADELHVHNLAVKPESRGEGLGRRLLELALSLGQRRGARVALLEVRQSNEAALALYRSFGFEAVGFRRNYYMQPLEDALVLRKDGLGMGPRQS